MPILVISLFNKMQFFNVFLVEKLQFFKVQKYEKRQFFNVFEEKVSINARLLTKFAF